MMNPARLSLFGPEVGVHGVEWKQAQPTDAASWECGYCGNRVLSKDGWTATMVGTPVGYVRICPECLGPTFFDRRGNTYPSTRPGRAVEHVPADVAALYEEARLSAGANAHTAAVLVCRKILMHIAVAEGAEENKSFVSYVEYLATNGFVPPHGKSWVDYIRTRSNEANHEIVAMTRDDALALITFVEMLLHFIYEVPPRVPTVIPPAERRAPTRSR